MRCQRMARSGPPLHTGDLISAPPQFVPPDFGTPVPWNRVLKNNFWNGSYVFEWADAEKTALKCQSALKFDP